MMVSIREDLAMLGVAQDVFVSEAALVRDGKLEQAEKVLNDRGLIYRGVLEPPKGKTPEDWEPREQTLFRATQFGDEVDRPLRKSDGCGTYFANDIANHLHKIERGFAELVMCGAPTTAATSSACRRRSARCPATACRSTSCWCRSCRW